MHSSLPHMHWCGIELGVMASGVPDDNFCWMGTEGWCEYKWTDTMAVGLEPEQVGWILRRMRAGGRVFVVTWRQSPGGPRLGEPQSALYIHEGWDAGELKSGGLLAAPPALVMAGGPSAWDWKRVGEMLVGWEMSRR